MRNTFNQIVKVISVLFFVFCHIGEPEAQVLFQINENDYQIWNYNGGDEFNGTTVDTSKWLGSYPWGRNLYCSYDRHYYTDFKNCKLKDGVLSLIGLREEIVAKAVPYESEDYRLVCNGEDLGANLKKFDFSTGMIFSKEKYLYGYYEIRFRSNEGKGLWPAFWLYAGVENEEIDIFEMNGSWNNKIHVDVHCPSGCKNYKTTLGLLRKNWGDYLSTSAYWQDGFNVVSLEWQPGYIKWFLNGEGIAYWKGKLNNPMWLIADIAIANDNRPFGPGPDASTVFPAVFDIDYIRIWSKNKNDNSKNNIELTLTSNVGSARLTKPTKPEYKKKQLSKNPVFIILTPRENNFYEVSFYDKPDPNITIIVEEQGNELFNNTNSKFSTNRFQVKRNATLKITYGDQVINYTL